jgi:hypothetical protein
MTQSTLHSSVLRRFIVDASNYNCRIGDYVNPGTTVGKDPETDEDVVSGLSGQVAAVYACHEDNTMLVFIRDITV